MDQSTDCDRDNAKLVADFGLDMLIKLNENNHKQHWSACSFRYLTTRILQEVLELHVALEYNSLEEAIRECADVANFAAMVADNCKAKLQKQGG